MAANGTYRNPSTRDCWTFCTSCNRCGDKGKYAKCADCSGRYDPSGRIDPHPDDFCQCSEGVLRWRTQQGRVIITKFKTNPFKGEVRYQKKSQDERDWDSYVSDMREKMNDPNWNPITMYEE